MKHARKLASLLLALVMVFALATTAFAAETGTTTTTGTGNSRCLRICHLNMRFLTHTPKP